MPVSNRTRAPATADPPDKLRPYAFHGLDLSVKGVQAFADCPFCLKGGKFTVEVDTGLWRCFVCGGGQPSGGGNALTFLRALHASLVADTPPALAATIARDRRLLAPATVSAWGVCGAPGPTWCVPGYSWVDGAARLDQVYRRSWVGGKWCLLPTPGVWPDGKVHALHLPTGFDPARPRLDVCEGPWDGMVTWEVSQDPTTNVVAVPGCNVWRDEWTTMCRGKHVTLWFDSDHPVPEALARGRTVRPGLDGMCRVAKLLNGHAASVRFVRWGREGYDPDRPSGWDVRDHLAAGGDGEGRRAAMADLLSKVEDAPREWFVPGASANGNGRAHRSTEVEPESCSEWSKCEVAWRDALEWRDDLGGATAVLLAVCASTKQAGNQLFLDLIGSPGSAKTTICRALLVSHHCAHLENMTKLISGYKMKDDKDCSFLARNNNKTWVTCEFDTLGSSPQYHELMGKVRRIFDGETSATYGNSDEDRLYAALRTPWIRAGTPKMMDHDQSSLGDRFLRYILPDPDAATKRRIVRSAMRSELRAMLDTSNGTTGSVLDPNARMAYALTGGYVNWLRANVEEKLPGVDVDINAEDRCADLAELSADLRARPISTKKKQEAEPHECKELHTRLARQNVRLARHLAVVLNKRAVDADVLRIVRKVALDTAYGHSLNIVGWMCGPNPKADGRSFQESGGLMDGALMMWTGMTAERLMNYMLFLRKIDVVELRKSPNSGDSWVLTERVYDLFLRIKKD